MKNLLPSLLIVLPILFILLSTSCLTAQTTVTGLILDEDGEALAGANCFLEGTYDGATSDESGAFSFQTDRIGSQTLKVSFIGYAIAERRFDLDSLKAPIRVQMKELVREVDAVVISAGSFEASDEKKAVVLNSLDMVTTAGASGDVYGALQTLPGTSTNGESGGLFVRGGSSEEAGTYINGTLVHQALGASAPQVPARGRFSPFMFKGTIFSTGGFSAEYGDALSSVLLLQTVDAPMEDQLNISLLSVGGDLAAVKAWEGGALTASANYTNLGPYLALVPQNLDWRRAPRNAGSSVSLWQETSSTGKFRLYAAVDRARLALDLASPEPDVAAEAVAVENDNLFVNASWKDLVGEKTMLESGVSFSLNRQSLSQGTDGRKKDLNGLHLKSVLTRHLSRKIKLRGGLEYFKDARSDLFSSRLGQLTLDLRGQRAAGFLETDLHASNKLVGKVGGRLDYDPVSGRFNAAPRLSLAAKTGDHSQVSLAYGWFFQRANAEDRLFAPGLEAERADHYILNYTRSHNKRHFRSEVFFKDYSGLVKYNSSTGWPLQGYNNGGRGYAYGFDFFFRDKKSIKYGDYWISYSFLETKRDFRDYPELATPTFSSRHNLSVVYKHWITDLRSQIGMTFTYGSPRVYHDPNSSGFNTGRTPAFRSLDVNWSFLFRQNIIFHAAISNVPGFKNEFGRRFTTLPDANGFHASQAILPPAPRFFLLGCFITLTKSGTENQLDKIN